MNTIALIPARGGSKGIPGKNIKLFNSKPLIYWSIQTALNSNYIDRVIVSTDDEEIAEVAKSYSAEVPFLRPKKFATDESPGIDPVIHALENIPNVDNVLLLQPTSPFRENKHVEEIFQLSSEFNSDSVVSISLSKKHIDLFFYLNDNKKITGYNDKIKSLPRQQYQNLYTLNGSLYLSTKDSIFSNKSFITPKTIGYVMADKYSFDIDNQLDWELAEFTMKKYSDIKLDFNGSCDF